MSSAAPRPARLGTGWAVALFSTACFSLAPPLGKAAIDLGMNSLALLAVRMAATAALLGATLALTEPRRLVIDRRGLWLCLAAGLTNGVGMVMFFRSLERLEASIASMIFSLSPNWHLAGGLIYSRLVGDAADSPVTDDRGSANQFFAGLGIAYAW